MDHKIFELLLGSFFAVPAGRRRSQGELQKAELRTTGAAEGGDG
jgi:hypothetical protein